MTNKLVCCAHGHEFSAKEQLWQCSCGSLLNLQTDLKEMEIREDDPTLWRYRDLLPLDSDETILTLGEGMTPLLQRKIGDYPVYLKMEFMSPTGSFKDRGAAILMAKVRELGIERVVEDSSGNAGAAIAAYAAAAGIECEIYLPEATSEGKIKQIKAYGAKVVKIPGDRDATSRAIWEAAQTTYYASHVWNPYFFAGTKTMAYELWEQLGFAAPDTLIIPVGNGTMLLGAYYGFLDLLEMGQIDTLPRIIAVQSAQCTPIYAEFHNLATTPVRPTVAEGISVGQPARKAEIIAAIHGTGGQILAVEDEQVLQGVAELSKMGIYVEPTSGTVVAALYQALECGLIHPTEKVILPLTGSGLKKG